MESLIYRLFFHQWQRKLVALLTATVIWIFVSHSIISSKTLPSVPIRVINLPTDKTIPGLLPNGFLSKRTTLTLTGTKAVIDQLEPGDVEILLDASSLPNDGIVQITKKHLVSLNPNFNLPKYVNSISHPEFAIKMSPILTEKITITLHHPQGIAPKGYEFLDIWPLTLTHIVTGPQDQVLALKNQGLELVFNLNDITKEQLDAIQGTLPYDDEITFYVPESWKKILIPFSTRGPEPINDPDAHYLQLNFLRQHIVPVDTALPLHVYYPLKYSDRINPNTYPLESSSIVQFKNTLPILTVPLSSRNVSKLFLEIVKGNIELEIVAAPPTEREKLEWGVGFIDETHLEDTYAAFQLSNSKNTDVFQNKNREREKLFRERFRLYVRHFVLYIAPENKLELESRLEGGKIRIHVPNLLSSKQSEPQNENPG